MRIPFRLSLALSALCLLALSTPAKSADPVPPSRLPGKIIWYDLVTPDVAAAKKFYGEVFGWTFAPSPGPDGWTLIRQGSRDIGGLVPSPKGKAEAGNRWIPLLSVADAALATRTASKQGGKMLIKPTAMAWRGTHALLRDADGALIGLLQTNSGDAPDEPVADNNFFWAELLTTSPAKAAEFYRTLAGYEVSDETLAPGLSRVVLSSGGVARSSIAPLPENVSQPGWLPYVLVSDIPASLARVSKAGGRVLVAPQAELLEGQLAVVADPSGGVIGLVNWTNEPAN